MGITAAGRMINADISRSKKIAQLSPKALALFCLLIPHFNAHGKMLANKHLIKGLVCPYIEWLTVEDVEFLLMEISDKTNVKYWQDENGEYLQSINWQSHQKLETKKLGPDYFPSCPTPFPDYSETTRRLLADHSLTKLREVEEEEEVKTPPKPPVETDRMTAGELRQEFTSRTKRIMESGGEITVLQDLAKSFTRAALLEGIEKTCTANPNYPFQYFVKIMRNPRASPEPDYDAIAAELKAQEAANAN
jgi:hypothetical protein